MYPSTRKLPTRCSETVAILERHQNVRVSGTSYPGQQSLTVPLNLWFLVGVSRRSLWSPSLSSFGYRQIQGKNVPPYHPSNKATALQKLLWDPQPNHCVYNNPLNSLKMHFIQLVMVVSTLFAASTLADPECECQYQQNNPTYICCYLQIHEGLPNDIYYSSSDNKCYSDSDEINGTEFLDCCLRYGADWGTCYDQ